MVGLKVFHWASHLVWKMACYLVGWLVVQMVYCLASMMEYSMDLLSVGPMVYLWAEQKDKLWAD